MQLRGFLIWEKAVELCSEIYDMTRSFPKEETYGLTAQLRRSGVSVVSNIAEGEGRLTAGERRQALSHARGSLYEIETQFLIAQRLRYVPENDLSEKIAELIRMIDAYIVYVRKQ